MNIFLNEILKFDGLEYVPQNESELNEILVSLLKTLESFKFHNDVKLYYSSLGMKVLLDNFQLVIQVIGGTYDDSLDALRVLLSEINAVDWTLAKLHRDDILYYHQQNLGATPFIVNESTVGEATEYKYLNNKVALLNLLYSDYNTTNPAHINRSEINPPPKMDMVVIETVKQKSELINYILTNRAKRIYNHNPKHGENGLAVIPNKNEVVSPLEGSIAEAEDLLVHAVSTSAKNEFYAYDNIREKFIVFKADTATFHGYHPIDQNEVPQAVKKFLLD